MNDYKKYSFVTTKGAYIDDWLPKVYRHEWLHLVDMNDYKSIPEWLQKIYKNEYKV